MWKVEAHGEEEGIKRLGAGNRDWSAGQIFLSACKKLCLVVDPCQRGESNCRGKVHLLNWYLKRVLQWTEGFLPDDRRKEHGRGQLVMPPTEPVSRFPLLLTLCNTFKSLCLARTFFSFVMSILGTLTECTIGARTHFELLLFSFFLPIGNRSE